MIMLQTIATLKTRYEEALFENFRLNNGILDYLCGLNTFEGCYALNPTMRSYGFPEFEAAYPAIANLQMHSLKICFDDKCAITSLKELVRYYTNLLYTNDILFAEVAAEYPDEQFSVSGSVVSLVGTNPIFGYDNSPDESFMPFVYNTANPLEITFAFVRVILVAHFELRMTQDPVQIGQMMQEDIAAYRLAIQK